MASHEPLLTYIVPAYNAAATLPDTLASLRGQTMQRWSAIVIDDGSTDATADVARATSDARIQVVSQENRGLAGARNTGLRHLPRGAHAPLVSFLDADDTIAPNFGEAMLAALGGHDAIACAFELTGPRHEFLGWVTRPAPHDSTLERLIESNAFAVTGVFRVEALRRLATLPSPPARPGDLFDESLRVVEDWDLWVRATAAGLRWAAPLDQPLFRYRLMPGLSSNIELMWTTGLKVISRAPAPEVLKPRALRRWTVRSAARAIANEDPPLALAMLTTLGDLNSDDLATMAGSLTPAFQRAELVGPALAPRHHSRWRARVSAAMTGSPWCAPLLSRFDSMTIDWSAAARRIASALLPGDIPTLYGMGWNGQALITELASLLPNTLFGWIDDNPAAAPPASVRAQRLTTAKLTPRHAVILTPNDPAPMLARLAAQRLRILWPPALLKNAA